jgi:hypothetical protein
MRSEGFKSMKNLKDPIGNRTRDTPPCSAVPRQTVLQLVSSSPANGKTSQHRSFFILVFISSFFLYQNISFNILFADTFN